MLVLLLVPHPVVLELDLDLLIGEMKPRSRLQPAPATQVRAEVEFLLQLQQLAVGEGHSLPPASAWGSSVHATTD